MKDYYDILGVPRNASEDDIKRAYRILAQQFHPDKENGSEKRFKEINEAYRVLSGASSKTDYDRQYDSGLPDEDEFEPPTPTSAKKPTKRRNYWVGVITFLVAYSLVRLAIGGLSSPSTAANVPAIAPDVNSAVAAPSYTPPSDLTGGTDSASASDGTTTQFPAGKCVTESGVQICDLSYNVTNTAGNTRTASMQGNEIVCEDISTDLSTDVKASTAGISTDPTFCGTDYGSVYIDPSISVAKHYGGILTGGDGDYIVPSNYGPCIWTYDGGNGDIPYIQLGDYIGPDTSFYNVHAFCQSGANEVDIFTQPTTD
jgi:hypothetical protein